MEGICDNRRNTLRQLDNVASGSAQLWRVACPPPRRGRKIACIHTVRITHGNAFAAPVLAPTCLFNLVQNSRHKISSSLAVQRCMRPLHSPSFRGRRKAETIPASLTGGTNVLCLPSTTLPLPALGRDDCWEVQMVLSKCLARTRRWSDRRRTTPFVLC
jgi:hypothetical protein